MFEKILVGVDGSAHASAALSAAGDIAKQTGGEVRVIHVRELTPAIRAGLVPSESPEAASEVVTDAVRELEAAGVKASGVTRNAIAGHVAVELLEEAKASGSSVIVLATRGLSDLAGLVLGSTTHKVLHLGHIPVLVVR